MLCIIYYNTCIFNTVLYTIMCMISINNNNKCICELCGEKKLQIALYFLLCSCLINLRTIMSVTFDLVA